MRLCGMVSYMALRPKMSIQGIMKKAADNTRMRMFGGRLFAAPSICPVSACLLTSCTQDLDAVQCTCSGAMPDVSHKNHLLRHLFSPSRQGWTPEP